MPDISADLVALMPAILLRAKKITGNVHDAEDLTQTAIEIALTQQHRFDPVGGSLQAWVFQIMRFHWLDKSRRKRFHGPMPEHWDVETPGSQEAAVHVSEATGILETLDPVLAEAVVAGAMGETIEDLSHRTGVAPGTAKSRVSRGRKLLRDIFEGTK